MAPKAKAKGVADSSDDCSIEDSSDADDDASKARAKRRRNSKPTFAKQRIYESVMGDSRQSLQARLPSHFVDSEVADEWGQWLESVPEHLAEVPAPQRAVRLRMPMKHNADQSAVVQAPAAARPQQKPLMTYRNPHAGTSYAKDERERDALYAQPLRVSELPLSSTVALRRSTEDPYEPAGYGTPFYIADVLEVELGAAGTSTADPPVAALTVHYRIPSKSSRFCNDVRRPFLLACHAGHPWDAGCETRRTCKRMRPEGADMSKYTPRVEAATIFEAGIELTRAKQALSMSTRKRLAKTDPSWCEALGVDPL